MEIRIFNVLWTSINGGPSPDNNKRTELFLSGCKMAKEGNPCKGCFNPDLWDDNVFVAKTDPVKAAEHIEKYAPNKYITIVGGEPLDQREPLMVLLEELRKRDFHVILFTHYTMEEIRKVFGEETVRNIMDNADILIDGKYDSSEHIYDDSKKDGFHNAIGSGNQKIWILNHAGVSYRAGEVLSFKIIKEKNTIKTIIETAKGVDIYDKDI